MATVTLHTPGGICTLYSQAGETLHQTLTRAGVYHHAPCGGNGLCKNCLVRVSGEWAPPTKKEIEFLTDQQLLEGFRYCCMAIPTGDCQVDLQAETVVRSEPVSSPHILSVSQRRGYCLGIDIGTTTLAVYLYAPDGRCSDVSSQQNRQSVFGDDVISRIERASQPRILQQMQRTVSHQLTDMIHTVCETARIHPGDITHCAIAANTTMLHLLTELDPTPMGKAPFTPQSLFGTMYRGEQLGLPVSCDVYLIPCISAYVGGDITAGIAVCDMDTTDATALLIDVGTNGEMVLCHEGQLYSLATAAGPAFEGAHIHCGVGGIPGAICRVDDSGYRTIDDAPPCGICGSGLIDAVGQMLTNQVIDETGYMEEDHPLTPDAKLVITPKDIREIQLAKSAICSGVLRLCELAGITPEQIDRVYFAGGFGSHIDPHSAAVVGLIPQNLADKCHVAGNTAGLGAVQAALSDSFRMRLEELPDRITYFELSGDARFNELFMENMLFEG